MQLSNNDSSLPVKTENSLVFDFGTFLKWLILRPYRSYRYRSQRYRLLSPRYAKEQRLFDARTGETFTLSIRDRIDQQVVNQIFIQEDYRLERLRRHDELYARYRAICKANAVPLIVDLGANTGLASFYFNREFPGSKILAVEPDKNNVMIAQKNNRENHNVKIIHAGISNTDGRGEIVNPRSDNWAYRTEIVDEGSIRMMSMQSLCKQYCTDKVIPFIVKIDIEGFESQLFSSATEWVDQFPLLIIELHDWLLMSSASSRTFLHCISQLNRDFIHIGENVFSIKNFPD